MHAAMWHSESHHISFLKLLRAMDSSLTLTTSGPALQLPQAARSRGEGGSLPCPYHRMADEGWGHILQAHPPVHPHPRQQGQLYCAAKAKCRASFLSPATGKGVGPSLPHPCCLITDKQWGEFSHTHAFEAGSPAPTNRVGSTVPPRWVAGPALQSTAADGGRDNTERLLTWFGCE